MAKDFVILSDYMKDFLVGMLSDIETLFDCVRIISGITLKVCGEAEGSL